MPQERARLSGYDASSRSKLPTIMEDEMAHTNDVTLFSNGIGHFRRVYDIPAGEQQQISIPFKRDHIGDVAASLQVFGDVKLNSPPSFTPINSNATALRINPSDAMASMLQSLSGARVTITANGSGEYTLIGIDEEIKYTSNGNIEESVLVLMNENGIQRKYLKDVRDIQFVEESVRTEIDKALKNNFQKIKPDSTLLDLCISAKDKATQAHIQYTIPVAAWKMRYTLHQEGSKSFRIEGAAIIDNCTDEDWNDFKISVVTGNPISFNTDIAEVVIPQRRMVRLVDGTAMGNVTVDDGITLQQCASGTGSLDPESFGGARPAMARSLSMGIKGSVSNRADFGLEPASLVDVGAMYAAADGPTEIETREVGDFCIFSSKETITILARKSAVVPMFSVPLEKAGAVLLYKERNHARRPYRAVKFKNETEYSLGKGKALIYNKGVFSGECVLQTTKPGENRMLPHCLENGVKIRKESKPVETRTNSIRLSKGSAFEETISTSVTAYVIQNMKDGADPEELVKQHEKIFEPKFLGARKEYFVALRDLVQAIIDVSRRL